MTKGFALLIDGVLVACIRGEISVTMPGTRPPNETPFDELSTPVADQPVGKASHAGLSKTSGARPHFRSRWVVGGQWKGKWCP